MATSGPHTRGFLFADLRGYSAFTDRHGDQAASELLGRYRELVRREIAAFHGAEIRTEGDSFYVVFESVSEAVQAALAIRQSAREVSADPSVEPIRVGIGVHAGETTDGTQGIVSSAVNVASRVCAQARPGEVLVTETVRSLTRTLLPVTFASRGTRRLKGIAEPVRVYRVTSQSEQDGGRARLRPMTSVTLGLVGLAVVALVVIGAQRLGLVAKADAPVASAATASELPVETHDLSHYTDPGEFPSDAEAALLEKLQSEVAMRCERADPVEVPEFYFRPTRPNELPGTMELGIRAGVNCLTGQVRVIYWQASASPGGADELFFNLVLKRSIPPGDCAADKRAYADWSAGAHDGHVMCYTVPAGSVLEWSYSAANIYAIATRRDGDSAALYKWWRDIGRLLSR